MLLDRFQRGVSHRWSERSQVDQEIPLLLTHNPLGRVELEFAAPELRANFIAQPGFFAELARCCRTVSLPGLEGSARYYPEPRSTGPMIVVANEEYGLRAVENDDPRHAPQRRAVSAHMLGLSTMRTSPPTGVNNAAAPQVSQRRARAW